MKESQAWLVPFFGHSLLGRNDSLQPLGSTLDDQLSSSSWRLHRERATDSSPAAHRLTRGVVQYVTDTSLSSKLQCWPTYLRFLTTAQSIQLFVDSSCWVIALGTVLPFLKKVLECCLAFLSISNCRKIPRRRAVCPRISLSSGVYFDDALSFSWTCNWWYSLWRSWSVIHCPLRLVLHFQDAFSTFSSLKRQFTV